MSVEFDDGFPEDLTQGLLIGKLLIGGLGVVNKASGGSHQGSEARLTILLIH